MKQISSMTGTLVAVFLFSYSVSISLEAATCASPISGYTFTKSGTLPVNPDTQLPFEERDEKADDEFPLMLICLPAEFFSFNQANNRIFFTESVSHAISVDTHVPIYLAKHALII